jgi:uncharacterized protein
MPARNDYRQALAVYIGREARPVDKYGHQPRLYALARRIAKGLEYDDDVIYAAAWMHDLGVFTGHRPEDPEELARWDHVAYTIARTPAILSEAHFPPEKIPAVVEVIRTHQPPDAPTCLEGVILRDADILERLGAIGILRAAGKVGRDTRFPRFTDAVAALRRSLATLPGKLRLESSRQLAEPKVQILEAFLTAVLSEDQGALF